MPMYSGPWAPSTLNTKMSKIKKRWSTLVMQDCTVRRILGSRPPSDLQVDTVSSNSEKNRKMGWGEFDQYYTFKKLKFLFLH